jgi:c-di-GMP-binding flagellar brake protein YcgR
MVPERRRYIRVRPSSDYDLRVELVDDGITYLLQVVDVAIGGIGLLLDGPVLRRTVGERISLVIQLPRGQRFEVKADIQHMSQGRGVCGINFVDIDETGATALGRYVSELLVRGYAV